MLGVSEKKNLISIIHRSYLYRMYAIVFSAAGCMLFGYIYFNYIQENLAQAMQNPTTALAILIPFLPGAFLAYRAEKLQTRARKIIQQNRKKR